MGDAEIKLMCRGPVCQADSKQMTDLCQACDLVLLVLLRRCVPYIMPKYFGKLADINSMSLLISTYQRGWGPILEPIMLNCVLGPEPVGSTPRTSI